MHQCQAADVLRVLCCVSWKAVHLADYPTNFYAGCIHIPLLSVIQESGVFESILNTG